MTDELKEKLHQNMMQIGELMYEKVLEAAEQAEVVFPENFNDEQKSSVVEKVIASTFAAQKNAIEKGFEDVQKHLQDKDYMQEVLKNVRQS